MSCPVNITVELAMAARSFFLGLRRASNTKIKNGANSNSESLFLSRFLSSGSSQNECLEEETSNSDGKDDLKSRIFRIGLPKRSATNVIQRWVSEGKQATISGLRHILKELRKSQRYKHALEV